MWSLWIFLFEDIELIQAYLSVAIFLWRMWVIFHGNQGPSFLNDHILVRNHFLLKSACILWQRNQTYSSISGHILARSHVLEMFVDLPSLKYQIYMWIHTREKAHSCEVYESSLKGNLYSYVDTLARSHLLVNFVHLLQKIYAYFFMCEVCGSSFA